MVGVARLVRAPGPYIFLNPFLNPTLILSFISSILSDIFPRVRFSQSTMADPVEHFKERSNILVQSDGEPIEVEITGPEDVIAEKKGTHEDQRNMWRMGKVQEMRVRRAQTMVLKPRSQS